MVCAHPVGSTLEKPVIIRVVKDRPFAVVTRVYRGSSSCFRIAFTECIVITRLRRSLAKNGDEEISSTDFFVLVVANQ